MNYIKKIMSQLGILDDKYKIISKSGIGLTSEVYKIEEKETQKIYAAKVFNNKYNNFFLNEVEILSFLKTKNIPNIIKFERSGNGTLLLDNQKEERNFIIMEYAHNLNLFLYTTFFGKGFQEKHAKYFFYLIVKAVQSIHENKICHLDLKPANIMLNQDSSPKICDFGFANYLYRKIRNYNGTDKFIPPEIIKRIPYDGIKADIFSLGVILFALVFGKFAFEKPLSNDSNYKYIMNNNDELFWNKFPEAKNISDDFKKLYFKMVSYVPENRPTTEEILKNNWLKEIIDLGNNVKNLETEINEVIYQRALEIEKKLKVIKKLKEYNDQNKGNKSSGKDEKEYFTCETIIEEIEEEKCRNNYIEYIKLERNLNPVDFMNDLANKIEKNNKNCRIEISKENKFEFKIFIEEEIEEKEKEEQEEQEEKNEENEEEEKEKDDDNENKDNIINSNDVIIEIKLLKTHKDTHYLVFSNCLGELEVYYNKLKDIYNIVKKID